MSDPGQNWWREGVFYQVYPRSWVDSDSDGVGDLEGIRSRLDYLEWLGVDGIWINPVTVSPDRDWGYDVSDYVDVQPVLGKLETLTRLVADAGRRRIRVLLDLVPNHSSDRHPWFQESRSSRANPRRDWYVWADPRRDGSPPNNWRSEFGGPAWTLDQATGQYYLHQFLPEQPDLNWWNPEVATAFERVLRFWFDLGVAGFRIDTAHHIVKDRRLRDNPPATADDHPLVQERGYRSLYTTDRPEVHRVLRRFREIADSYNPPRLLVGETYVMDVRRLAAYYGAGNELNLAFNFSFVHSPFDAAALRQAVESSEAAIPAAGWPVWTGSNHDVSRFPTRWAKGRREAVRCGLLLLLTLRGTPFLYYGDEIGMVDVELGKADLKDPVGIRQWPARTGRDRARTPMQWSSAPGSGFTADGVRPWLPVGAGAEHNVVHQRPDPGSELNLTRDLIHLRRRTPDLLHGAYQSLPAPTGVWAYRRGDRVIVALNLRSRPATIRGLAGRILIATDRSRDGSTVAGSLRLDPWQAAVLEG